MEREERRRGRGGALLRRRGVSATRQAPAPKAHPEHRHLFASPHGKYSERRRKSVEVRVRACGRRSFPQRTTPLKYRAPRRLAFLNFCTAARGEGGQGGGEIECTRRERLQVHSRSLSTMRWASCDMVPLLQWRFPALGFLNRLRTEERFCASLPFSPLLKPFFHREALCFLLFPPATARPPNQKEGASNSAYFCGEGHHLPAALKKDREGRSATPVSPSPVQREEQGEKHRGR